MFKIFRRKQTPKESKYASTPDPVAPATDSWTKLKVFFFLWNIISITLYSAYTMFVIYKLSINTFLSKAIMWLLLAYAFAFVLLVLINLGNRKRMNRQLKNYKSATNFLKYAIQILNFVLAITTAISALITTGTTDFSAVLWAVISFILTIVAILFEVVKIIIRRNIFAIKQNFLDIREKPKQSKFSIFKQNFKDLYKKDRKTENKSIEKEEI